ncbi:hypothetical protein F4859DRAFT_460000 [Xylaria cf. heliscus]|nr:hypothetical protein F4859DRAFT_460000 [Xylaria cf. heliscus]
MGTTGSGKSSLINLCTDQEIEIGHDLKSCTQDVKAYTIRHPTLRSGRVYLVDTPGFDDTNRNDTEILRTLGAWLTATYSSGVQLSGIIYCHQINQTRMQGSALKNIQVFRSLCGDDALSKVVLVTTMWDKEKLETAEKREKELKETAKYWGGMVAKGSKVLRHNNTQQSAFALIETFIKDDSKIVLGIQKEMVNDQKPLDKTEAGKDVKVMLEEQNVSLRVEIQNFESQLKEALRKKDEELAEVMKELRLEHKQALQQVLDNQQRLQATMQQLHESKFAELEARLEDERQKWQSRAELQSPNEIFGGSIPNINQPARVPRRLSPHPPSKVEIKYVNGRLSGHDNYSTTQWFQISPDGSHFVISQHDTSVLIATDTLTLVHSYTEPRYSLYKMLPQGFSSDGQTLALLSGVYLYKTKMGSPHVQLEHIMNEKRRRLGRVAMSSDLKTVVDIVGLEFVLTRIATNISPQSLKWTEGLSKSWPTEFQFLFAKNDELLICGYRQNLYFFSTRKGKLLGTQPIPGSENLVKPASKCILSGDTLTLGVTVFENDNLDRGTVFTSFFRLSGSKSIAEFTSTISYHTRKGPKWRETKSLSFDGRYFAQYDDRYRGSIFHVMSGKMLFRHNLSEMQSLYSDRSVVEAVRFFPSDNRILFISPSGYFIGSLVAID